MCLQQPQLLEKIYLLQVFYQKLSVRNTSRALNMYIALAGSRTECVLSFNAESVIVFFFLNVAFSVCGRMLAQSDEAPAVALRLIPGSRLEFMAQCNQIFHDTEMGKLVPNSSSQVVAVAGLWTKVRM